MGSLFFIYRCMITLLQADKVLIKERLYDYPTCDILLGISLISQRELYLTFFEIPMSAFCFPHLIDIANLSSIRAVWLLP